MKVLSFDEHQIKLFCNALQAAVDNDLTDLRQLTLKQLQRLMSSASEARGIVVRISAAGVTAETYDDALVGLQIVPVVRAENEICCASTYVKYCSSDPVSRKSAALTPEIMASICKQMPPSIALRYSLPNASTFS